MSDYRDGKYIVIEGHDGTGKSTQVANICQKLSAIGIESIEFHEPAGSPLADEIRTILKNGSLERDPKTNMLLFSAARCELWETRAKVALKMGKWVVTSRNYFSTLAYQGYGEGISLDLIEAITQISTDDKYMNPDFAIILDLENEGRKKRIEGRGKLETPDMFESKDEIFQTKVRNGYLDIAQKRALSVISADKKPEIITNEIWSNIELLLKK